MKKSVIEKLNCSVFWRRRLSKVVVLRGRTSLPFTLLWPVFIWGLWMRPRSWRPPWSSSSPPSPGGAEVQESGRVAGGVRREVQPRGRRVRAEDERVLPGRRSPSRVKSYMSLFLFICLTRCSGTSHDTKSH